MTSAPARGQPDDLPAFRDAGHGYDVFGLDPRAARRAARLCGPLYRRYFRVTSTGSEHLPATGAAILVANHAGTLPVDGAMLWLDVMAHSGRVLRPVADLFVAAFPIVNTVFARIGVVSGTRQNVRHLLETGELIAIFPEGTTGVAKPFRERYRLQAWRVGHAELAIRHRVPVIPVAIIGSEESWPVAFKLRGVRAFGAPYLPIPASPVPLPVRYHLHYGAPLVLHRDHPPEAADDPATAAAAAERVKVALVDLIARGLEARRAGAVGARR
ncbi:MAG: acyltransferase family protein [Kofleriaceae bacterium]|nr:acyltransferase family protein [Kofleriaceae bacterium]MCL4227547.1 acyltransferase family protein [Myxococcales bacterium]